MPATGVDCCCVAVKTPIRFVGPVTARLLCAIKEPETVAFELKVVVLAVKTPIRFVGPVTARLLCAIKEPVTVAFELKVVVLVVKTPIEWWDPSLQDCSVQSRSPRR